MILPPMIACPECGKPFMYAEQTHGHVGGAHVRKVPPLKEIEHGTPAGARAHRRRKERVCGPCRSAWAQYLRDYRKGKGDA